MTEEKEEKKESKEEEKKEVKPTYLEEVRAEREKMEKLLNDMRELKAQSIMGGEADAGQPREEKKEQTPEEYAKDLMSGKVEVD